MKKKYADKAMEPVKDKAVGSVATGVTTVYVFPAYQISIEATSMDEAQAELQRVLAKRKTGGATK
jgi:hypothetical protein